MASWRKKKRFNWKYEHMYCLSKNWNYCDVFPCFAIIYFFIRVIWQSSWNICTHTVKTHTHTPSTVVIMHMLRVIQWAEKNEITTTTIGIKMNKSRHIIRQWSESVTVDWMNDRNSFGHKIQHLNINKDANSYYEAKEREREMKKMMKNNVIIITLWLLLSTKCYSWFEGLLVLSTVEKLMLSLFSLSRIAFCSIFAMHI